MKSGFRAVFFSLIFLDVLTATAQPPGNDSLFYQTAAGKTIAVYYNQLNDQSLLYNGSQYAAYGFLFKTGSPYFFTEKFTTGSLIYSGMWFDSVSLLYNDLRQVLILNKANYQVQLINERISSFTITGHFFIRLNADSAKTGIRKTGFYQVIYPGRTQILKWTAKSIQSELSIVEGALYHIDESDTYYMKQGGKYNQIKSKSSFLELLKDRKKDLQRFMRKNKLKFRNDRDNTIIQTTGYYDQLAK